MITQEDLDSLSDRKLYVLETHEGKCIFVATGGSLKACQIFFLVTLVCTKEENFYIGKDVDENSPYSGLYVYSTASIRNPTMKEYLKFCKVMKENKIFYNKKTKEVKKL